MTEHARFKRRLKYERVNALAAKLAEPELEWTPQRAAHVADLHDAWRTFLRAERLRRGDPTWSP